MMDDHHVLVPTNVFDTYLLDISHVGYYMYMYCYETCLDPKPLYCRPTFYYYLMSTCRLVDIV